MYSLIQSSIAIHKYLLLYLKIRHLVLRMHNYLPIYRETVV